MSYQNELIEREAGPGARVLRSLRRLIDNGTYQEGQRLPSERELAEQFGVARTTVRDALAKISSEGLVRSNGGRLRIVSREKGHARTSDARDEHIGSLSSTILLVSNNPRGAMSHNNARGSADWIDQGVMEATVAAGFHYLAFNPAYSLASAEWRNLTSAKPKGISITDVFVGLDEAYSELAQLRSAGIPVIAYGNNAGCADFDRVASDHESGAYQLTKFLIERGARRILQIAPSEPDIYWFVARRAGYERAVSEAGLSPIPYLVLPRTNDEPTGGDLDSRVRRHDCLRRHSAGYLIDVIGPGSPVEIDAILSPSDSQNTPIAGACRMLGKIAGRDYLLAGYDNRWQDYDVEIEMEPGGKPIASIDKNNFAMGRDMITLLQERLGGQLPIEPQLRLTEPLLAVNDPK